MSWTYPVYREEVQAAAGESVAQRARRALSREAALAHIAGGDPRPLLVLRECLVCNGTDDALLKPGADNERTFLLANWFHCVKLPPDVLAEDHPYHALFLEEEPEHLFLSSVDGSTHIPLESQTSRSELWSSMIQMVENEYVRGPEAALKTVQKQLDALDVIDRKYADAERRRDELLEEDGPGSKKVRELDAKLKELAEERTSVETDFRRVLELDLRRKAPQAAGSKG